MKKFKIVKNINGIKLIKYFNSNDSRGNFSKIFSSDFFTKLGFKNKVAQINISSNTMRGTVRGFHYQKIPKNDQKILLCNKGSIIDVLIDIRKKSKNFLKIYKFNLNEKKNNCLFIPKGFAHGFQSLTNNTQVIYIHSQLYHKNLDTGIFPFDENLNFKWPEKITKVSMRDKNLPKINSSFKGI
tara:strand:- start:327 stop:878 length:552 start_codon:yes stop_codon:yes gene_type:complete